MRRPSAALSDRGLRTRHLWAFANPDRSGKETQFLQCCFRQDVADVVIVVPHFSSIAMLIKELGRRILNNFELKIMRLSLPGEEQFSIWSGARVRNGNPLACLRVDALPSAHR